MAKNTNGSAPGTDRKAALLTNIHRWRNWPAKVSGAELRGEPPPPREPAPPAVEIRDRWRTLIAPVALSDEAVRAMLDQWTGFECVGWERTGQLTDRLATNIVRDCWALIDAVASDRNWQRRFKERRIPRRGFSVAQALQELKRARRYFERRVAAANSHDAPDGRRKAAKKSTTPGDAQHKLATALIVHHRYENGGCGNWTPIGNNALAELAAVSQGSASRFFNQHWGDDEGKRGHSRYEAACRNKGILAKLRELNGDSPPREYRNAFREELEDDD